MLRWTSHGRRRRGRLSLKCREGIDKVMKERELEDSWFDRDQ